MRFARWFRGIAAAITGLLLTILFGSFTLAAALPYRFLIDSWARRLWRNPLEQMPRFWGVCVHAVCIKWLLKVSMRVDGTMRPLAPGERVLVIANHPSYMTVPSFVAFVAQTCAHRVKAVAKREHLYNPALGLPFWAIRAGIFINRENRMAALHSIRTSTNNIFVGATALIILPDKRRPSRARIANDLKRFARKIPGLADWLLHTLVPRSGGVHEIIFNLNGPVRTVNITCAMSVRDESLRDVHALYGATLHFKVEELTQPLPLEEEALRAWLIRKWQEKNALISAWRKTS